MQRCLGLTVKYMDYCWSGTGIGRHTRIVPRIRDEGLRNEQFASRASLSSFRLQADSPPRGIKVYHGVAVIPRYGRRRRRMHIYRTGQRYCATLFHVNFKRSRYRCLGIWNLEKNNSKNIKLRYVLGHATSNIVWL